MQQLKTQMIISQSMMKWCTISETQALELEEDNIVAILIRQCFSEMYLGRFWVYPCHLARGC